MLAAKQGALSPFRGSTGFGIAGMLPFALLDTQWNDLTSSAFGIRQAGQAVKGFLAEKAATASKTQSPPLAGKGLS